MLLLVILAVLALVTTTTTVEPFRGCAYRQYSRGGRCLPCPPYAVRSPSGTSCRCMTGFVPDASRRRCVRRQQRANDPTGPGPWRTAASTYYNAYPDPKSAEWTDNKGGDWAGWFAYLPDRKSLDWVKQNNIVSMYTLADGNAGAMAGRSVWLRKHGKIFRATVHDTCADSDCKGCCTANAGRPGANGTLMDIERYTCERVFGDVNMCSDGLIEWKPA